MAHNNQELQSEIDQLLKKGFQPETQLRAEIERKLQVVPHVTNDTIRKKALVQEWTETMQHNGLRKRPGTTKGWWKGELHSFYAGVYQPSGYSHGIDWNLVKTMLQQMKQRLLDDNHYFDLSWVTRPDLPTPEAKLENLCHHSEKIALAFFLVVSPPGSTIHLFKNLRVCGDCHAATKRLSKLYDRYIIIRDKNRIHHFKDGKCSCEDYW